MANVVKKKKLLFYQFTIARPGKKQINGININPVSLFLEIINFEGFSDAF